MKILYEVLVPTMYGYPKVTPISTRHHKNWDKEVQKITGGLTICKPVEGRWVDKGVEYPERVIPVRVMCEEFPLHSAPKIGVVDDRQIKTIIEFTLSHYRQKAVMFYVLSREVNVIYSDSWKPKS